MTHLAAVRAAIPAQDSGPPSQHRHRPSCPLFLHPTLDLNILFNFVSVAVVGYLCPDPGVIVREVNLNIGNILRGSHKLALHLGEVCGGEVIAGGHQGALALHLQQAAVKQGPVLLRL